MRAWRHSIVGLSLLLTLPLVDPAFGQDRPAPRSDASEDPELPDLSRLHPFQRVVYLSARRGAEWLWNANRPDGLFVPGHVPALKAELEGDDYLRQTGAAGALARAARFTGNSRYTARAQQALLALLASTKTDPEVPGMRLTVFPESEVNRLAAAGALVLALAELPQPAADLLEQMDQLSQFILRQQQADGSYRSESERAGQPSAAEELVAAQALWAPARSHAVRPAAWKLESVSKGLGFQRKNWAKSKQAALAPWLVCATAEAYMLTKEKAHAEFTFELADWMGALQYGAEPRHPLWQGGFAGWQNGQIVAVPPTIDSARFAQALAQSCRVARQAGEAQRFERYREGSERCLQFLTTLQYTSANTRHFADWYRPTLTGAFFISHQDGDLRLDSTQHALAAMTDYLEAVAQAKIGTGK